MAEAVKGASYIQECTPEGLQLKIQIFQEIETALESAGNKEAIIGSSCSTIMPSKFVAGLKIKDRVVVAHPVIINNYQALIEQFKGGFCCADKSSVLCEACGACALELDASWGHDPCPDLPNFFGNEANCDEQRASGICTQQGSVSLNKLEGPTEISTTFLCRYAILNETWRLVTSGVLSVEDADIVMKEGLAPRYIFMGPLETAHLNADGFKDYCKRYGGVIHDVSMTMGDIPLMSETSCEELDRQLEVMVPKDKLPERRNWRDESLAELATFKQKLGLWFCQFC